MRKRINILISLLLTDFCLFPISLQILPRANFKMLMAAMGVIIAAMDMLFRRKMILSRTLVNLSFYAGLISLAAYFSISYNATSDTTLVDYILSAWVWFFAAFTAVRSIRRTHGRITLNLLIRYLVAVCVLQCISALLIDAIPTFEAFINRVFFLPSAQRLGMAGRLYGIGADLDIAGIRFSCVLIMLIHLIINDVKQASSGTVTLYWVSYMIIAVVGCMIARTTTLGIGLSLAYYLWQNFVHSGRSGVAFSMMRGMIAFFLILYIAILGCITLYTSNPAFQEHVEFGFEGFFNYFEKGEFETNSTNILKGMVIWPSTFKTWMIGDGLFEVEGGFYKATDIGYLRFIFYFGLMGLTAFILLYIFMLRTGCRLFPESKLLIFMLFLTNMIIWIKVVTDTFVVFMLVINAGLQKDDRIVV